jgi:hypothetical protein
MKITIGPRHSGKTTRMIMESAKTGSYILVATKCQADCVYKQTKEMGINIPYPVTISEVITGRKYFDNKYMKEHGVLVDEAQSVLHIALCDIPIRGMTLNNDGNIDILEHGATHTLNAANLKEYSDLRERYNHPKREISTNGKLCCSECFHIVDITDHFCSKCGQRLE